MATPFHCPSFSLSLSLPPPLLSFSLSSSRRPVFVSPFRLVGIITESTVGCEPQRRHIHRARTFSGEVFGASIMAPNTPTPRYLHTGCAARTNVCLLRRTATRPGSGRAILLGPQHRDNTPFIFDLAEEEGKSGLVLARTSPRRYRSR